MVCGTGSRLVTRLVPILAAFALGVVVSRWMIAPSSVERETLIVKQVDARAVLDTTGAASPEERIVGVPRDTATAVKSAPGAGQRRAVARALAELEKHPADIEPSPVDPDRAAIVLGGIREGLLQAQGDQP